MLRKRQIDMVIYRWPDAYDLRSETCHCKHRALMISFLVPKFNTVIGDKQDCGYFCTRCRFSNAGRRFMQPVQK